MALLALNRKKQALAPDVRQLVIALTGFENEEHIRECETYVFSNFLHYQQPLVDGLQVQSSIDGLVQKFTIHGFPEKGKRLKTLVDNYTKSTVFEDHTKIGVEWYVLQLMVNLAYKPLSTSVDDNPLPLPPLPTTPSEESFDWGAYLKEGWEKFQLPVEDENDDELWTSESEEESLGSQKEIDLQTGNSKEVKSKESVPVYISAIPDPSTWRKKKQVPENKVEASAKIIRESMYSKVWLKSNLQSSWWNESHCKENVSCTSLKSANFGERWNEMESDKSTSTLNDLLVVSDCKVLREVLWMLLAPSSTVLFSQDENGKHSVNTSVTIPSVTQSSLYCILTRLCPYFDQIYDLKKFKLLLNQGELEDKPPPFTYKAFCDAVFKELEWFRRLVVEIETKVDRQDETNTLQSVLIDLEPGLQRLSFLHEMYKICITDWKTQPSWVCSTRLLSTLYTVLPSLVNNTQLVIALNLFLASFIVYLNIIDRWLCEGPLEDWRQEFLISRNGEEMCVMPYETEMKNCGVTPVPFLSKLVDIVKDAGKSVGHVIKLGKLEVLRNSAQNKGNLYKEFMDNVNEAIEKLQTSIHKKPLIKANNINLAMDGNETIDVVTNKELPEDEIIILYERNVSAENKGEINTSDLLKHVDSNIDNRMQHLNIEELKPICATMCDDKVTVDKSMYDLTRQVVHNPFLAEAFKEYVEDKEDGTQNDSGSYQLDTYRSAEILDIIPVHQVLEKQLDLLYSRHALSKKIVVETLITEYHLIEHFIVLRKVLMMESGNLIQNFYKFLFKEMTDNNWRNARNLTMQLSLCIEEEHPELGANFFVVIKDKESDKQTTPITEICSISIGYVVQWPVSMVISAGAVAKYNTIFSFLLCIKYAFWSLHNLRFCDFKKTAEHNLKLRRLFVLKVWIQHCVNTIHYYFMGHVLHGYATRLEEAIQQAEFIGDIINAHNSFLNAVQDHCLQKRLPKLKLIIFQVLELCPMLESVWRLEMEGKLSVDDIAQLESKYIETHNKLSVMLDLIVENASDLSSNIGHLAELNAEITSSLPENNYVAQ